MKASTSQFGFINSSPLLQDTFLCSPQPRLIFMQHLSWPVPFPRLAKCFEVAFLLHLLLLQAQGCAAQQPQHHLGVPQCHGFWALQLPFRQAQTTPFSCTWRHWPWFCQGAGQSLCLEGWDMGQSPLVVPCSCSTDSRGWSSESCSLPEAWVLFVNPFLVNTT